MTDTVYRVLRQADDSFHVELIKPGALPRLATGFPSETDAESWISEDKTLANLDPNTDQSVAWNGRL